MGEEFDRPRRVVAHDQDVGPHGVQGHRRVDDRLALLHRRIADRHVHHVGAEAFSGELEGGLGAGRGLEEEVDLGAAAQHRLLLLDLAADFDGLFGEVEEAGRLLRRHSLDPQKVPVRKGQRQREGGHIHQSQSYRESRRR
jgi:hypothetical protein